VSEFDVGGIFNGSLFGRWDCDCGWSFGVLLGRFGGWVGRCIARSHGYTGLGVLMILLLVNELSMWTSEYYNQFSLSLLIVLPSVACEGEVVQLPRNFSTRNHEELK